MQQCPWPVAAILLVALVIASTCHAAVTVRLHGQVVELSPTPQVRDTVLLGAPATIVGRLGCRFMSGDDHSLIIITPAGRRIVLTPGSSRFTVDDRLLAMPGEAFLAGDRLICPLIPVLEAIGAVVRWDAEAGRLDVETRIASIEVHADELGARIDVHSELASAGTLAHMEGPERYYVDLPGARVEGLEHDRTLVNLGAVLRVRWGQFQQDPAIARVVVDLRERVDVRWEPRADGLGGSLIVGEVQGDEPLIDRHVPTITRLLTSTPGEDTTLVTVELSDPVPFEYRTCADPPRVLLELPDAAPIMPIAPVAVDGPFVATASLQGAPGQPGATLTLAMRQLVHFEVVQSDDPTAITIIFRRGRIADRRIVIDPGHGGRDSGARGTTLLEKDVNLDVARQVAARLMEMGAQVVLTRDSDVFVDLYDRPRMANRIGADLFLSVHCNAMPRPNTGRGTETYYYHNYSQCLAVVVHQTLVAALGRRDNGVRWANFCVTRESDMPAVLVELMYLNTDEEEALLARPEVRTAAAEAIAEGLRRYVEGTAGTLTPGEMGM